MILNNKTILITGAAGFIGSALSQKLLSYDIKVIGVDNLFENKDLDLKLGRLNQITTKVKKSKSSWKFYKTSIEDLNALNDIFLKEKPNIVINLAAQAGVRYSLENPNIYFRTNLLGFGNILECCRLNKIEHLVYASSSSVYGGNKNFPFKESQSINKPVSLYAATKASNELMANSYSQNFNIAATGLRFFTVYGPWGRPDMAPIIFARSILNNETIKVNNFGKMKRDFTYIDDIIEGIFRCCLKPPKLKSKEIFNSEKIDLDSAPHKIFNIGNNKSIDLMYFIEIIEKKLNKKAKIELVPIPNGDVTITQADTNKLEEWIGFKPSTSIEEGMDKFLKWFKYFYKSN